MGFYLHAYLNHERHWKYSDIFQLFFTFFFRSFTLLLIKALADVPPDNSGHGKKKKNIR